MDADLHTLVVGRDAMACRFEVVFNAGEVADATDLGAAALDEVDRIEDRITIHRPGGELARLNARAAAGWQPVADDVWGLLRRAGELWEQTGGAFDMATGALSRCWGFLRRQGRTPLPDDLVAALACSGWGRVELEASGRRVRFTQPGVELNPGAIGKGWALDRAAAQLRDAGVPSVLVHGGSSSVLARGIQGPDLPGRRGWRVGLRHPLRPRDRLATLTLVDRSLGTSGSGTQFFIDRGRRLGHILDPRTGLPAEGVLSATVLAPSAADADALATAAYVLGPAGLERIAPAGGPVAAVVVVPGRTAGGVRALTANLDPEDVEWTLMGATEVVRAI
jgi:thiamine biosynthesis lipoprotein